MEDFNERTVVITGAANGIGRTLAVAYARQGARVALLDKDTDGLAHTQSVLRESGHTACARTLDLTDAADIPPALKDIAAELNGIDILVNNAGLGRSRSPLELSVEDWDYVLNTNLRGSFLCAREAARYMKEKGRGSIVNIASTRALMSEPDTEAYAASKGGLLALTHALAVSLGKYRITVNAISPGWIETGDYSKLKDSDHAQHPAGRVGLPADVARACLFLTHPENDFITGENLVVDGGMTRKMIYEE